MGHSRRETRDRAEHDGVHGRARLLTMWQCRGVSVALVPLTVIPFAAGSLSPVLDGSLIGLLILHSYMGFSCVRPNTGPSYGQFETDHVQRLHHRLLPKVASPDDPQTRRLGKLSHDLHRRLGFLRVRDERCGVDRSGEEDLEILETVTLYSRTVCHLKFIT